MTANWRIAMDVQAGGNHIYFRDNLARASIPGKRGLICPPQEL